MCALSRRLGAAPAPSAGGDGLSGANTASRHRQANGELNMGRFDSRNTTKMRQRRAQAKKKARAERRAEEVRAERKGKGKGKGKS